MQPYRIISKDILPMQNGGRIMFIGRKRELATLDKLHHFTTFP